MRRSALTAAAVATLFLAGGCSDEPEAKRPSPTAPTASSGRPTQVPATQPPSLDLPENAQVLMAETTGNKDQELPEFTPQEGAYTLYAACQGKGEVSVADRDNSDPHPVTCNGVHTMGVVHEDKKPQHLTIQVTGGEPPSGESRWSPESTSPDTTFAGTHVLSNPFRGHNATLDRLRADLRPE